jgi:hypothetical protein
MPERAKLAGAELPPGLSAEERDALHRSIEQAFVDGYRWAMALAAVLALASTAIAALCFPGRKTPQPSG